MGEEIAMGASLKISVIGAGSAQFSLGLVKDLCLTPGLTSSEVCFMDINTERLDIVHDLAVRYAQELGSQLRFSSTTVRAEALRESDVVIHTADVKGHHHARATRELTAKHGYYYGGIHLSDYDNINLMLEVARDMEELCPDAWLIMSGNPVFSGCTLVTRQTSIKVCGLCHGHYGVHEIARTLGLEIDRVTWQAPGLNHNIWLTHFLYDGKDAYPLLDAWIAEHGETYWRTHVARSTHDIQMSRGAVHQYQLYGYFPIGDTVRRGGWWYHTDIETKKYWFGEPWGGPDTELARPLFVKNLEERIATMARLVSDPKASLIEAFGSEKTKEQQVGIIDGLFNNNEGQFQVNIPNYGALPGIPDDVVVEVPAIVNAKGIQPLRVSPLPPKVMYAHVLPEWLQMERDLLAFNTGDRSLLLWNVLDSHQTRSYAQAEAVLEDILAMEGNQHLAAHYPPITLSSARPSQAD
jgi:alpha-galactosidase